MSSTIFFVKKLQAVRANVEILNGYSVFFLFLDGGFSHVFACVDWNKEIYRNRCVFYVLTEKTTTLLCNNQTVLHRAGYFCGNGI